MRYVVATDGACKRNPGPTGWAWVGEDGRWSAGSLAHGTNNVGELLALLNAMRDNARVEELVVQADSMYVINTFTKWMDVHARRGWTTATGQPAANRDILQQLVEARQARRDAGLADIQLEHVRGHAGHLLNSWADERAVRASQHGDRGLESAWHSDHGQERIDVTVPPSKKR